MRIINKKNKIIYNYKEYTLPEGVRFAIMQYLIAILFLIISILISFLCMGNAPSIIAGFGLTSLFFNAGSMANIILEVHLYGNYHSEIRTMLLLQLILFSIWIFII